MPSSDTIVRDVHGLLRQLEIMERHYSQIAAHGMAMTMTPPRALDLAAIFHRLRTAAESISVAIGVEVPAEPAPASNVEVEPVATVVRLRDYRRRPARPVSDGGDAA